MPISNILFSWVEYLINQPTAVLNSRSSTSQASAESILSYNINIYLFSETLFKKKIIKTVLNYLQKPLFRVIQYLGILIDINLEQKWEIAKSRG